MKRVALLFSAAMPFAAHPGVSADSQAAASVSEVGNEFRLFRSQSFDLKSALNGRVYRIMIGVPKRVAPTVPAPHLHPASQLRSAPRALLRSP